MTGTRGRLAEARTTVPVLAPDPVDLDQVERRLRERLDVLGSAPRADLLHVLMLPDFERAGRISEFWSYPICDDARGRRAAQCDAMGCRHAP